MNKQDHSKKWLSAQQFSIHTKATLSSSQGGGTQPVHAANAAERIDFHNDWKSSSIMTESW